MVSTACHTASRQDAAASSAKTVSTTAPATARSWRTVSTSSAGSAFARSRTSLPARASTARRMIRSDVRGPPLATPASCSAKSVSRCSSSRSNWNCRGNRSAISRRVPTTTRACSWAIWLAGSTAGRTTSVIALIIVRSWMSGRTIIVRNLSREARGSRPATDSQSRSARLRERPGAFSRRGRSDIPSRASGQ